MMMIHERIPEKLKAKMQELETLGGSRETRCAKLEAYCVVCPLAEENAGDTSATECKTVWVESDGTKVVCRNPALPASSSASEALRVYTNFSGAFSSLQSRQFGLLQQGSPLHESLAKNIFRWVSAGFNASLITYGPGHSGKTVHAMGMLDFFLEGLYSSRTVTTGTTYSIGISAWEILGEKHFDLLETVLMRDRRLEEEKLHKSSQQKPVEFLTVDCPTLDEARGVVAKAQRSSRNFSKPLHLQDAPDPLPNKSHLFIRIVLHSSADNCVSTLHLVDLAGFEDSEADGHFSSEYETTKRCQLHGFQKVVMELAKIQEGKKNKSGSSAGLVSARDSILNKSLVPLLAGNSKTFLLCMLKSGELDYQSSINTLRLVHQASTLEAACIRSTGVMLEDLCMLPAKRVLSHEGPTASVGKYQGVRPLLSSPGHAKIQTVQKLNVSNRKRMASPRTFTGGNSSAGLVFQPAVSALDNEAGSSESSGTGKMPLPKRPSRENSQDCSSLDTLKGEIQRLADGIEKNSFAGISKAPTEHSAQDRSSPLLIGTMNDEIDLVANQIEDIELASFTSQPQKARAGAPQVTYVTSLDRHSPVLIATIADEIKTLVTGQMLSLKNQEGASLTSAFDNFSAFKAKEDPCLVKSLVDLELELISPANGIGEFTFEEEKPTFSAKQPTDSCCFSKEAPKPSFRSSFTVNTARQLDPVDTQPSKEPFLHRALSKEAVLQDDELGQFNWSKAHEQLQAMRPRSLQETADGTYQIGSEERFSTTWSKAHEQLQALYPTPLQETADDTYHIGSEEGEDEDFPFPPAIGLTGMNDEPMPYFLNSSARAKKKHEDNTIDESNGSAASSQTARSRNSIPLGPSRRRQVQVSEFQSPQAKKVNSSYTLLHELMEEEKALRDKVETRKREAEDKLLEAITEKELQNDDLRLENQKLQSKLKAIEKGCSFPEIFQQFEDEISSLNKKCEVLQAHNIELAMSRDLLLKQNNEDGSLLLERKLKQIEQLQKENEKLQKKCIEYEKGSRKQQLHSNMNKQSQRKINDMSKQVQDQEDQLHSALLDSALYHGQLEKMEAEYARGIENEKALRDELERALHELSIYRQRTHELEDYYRKNEMLRKFIQKHASSSKNGTKSPKEPPRLKEALSQLSVSVRRSQPSLLPLVMEAQKALQEEIKEAEQYRSLITSTSFKL